MTSFLRSHWAILVVVILLVLPVTSILGRANPDAIDKGSQPRKGMFAPAHCSAAHNIGQIDLGINNNGTFGDGFRVGNAVDCFTGGAVHSCYYPKGSSVDYLFAASFWIGAVVGRDTAVSLGADGWSYTREMFPDELPIGNMRKRSILDPDNAELYEGAISEQDYLCVYTDTITEGIDPDYFGRPHRPLNIEVSQNSYAWSYSYAEDFVLFDYQIKNIGYAELEEVYMGVYVDGDVGAKGLDSYYADDISGFLFSYPATYGTCEYTDTIFAAWLADNDGDLGLETPCPSVTATRIVRTPAESLEVSFNWWISAAPETDFGPRHRADFRDYRTGGLGTPEGDVNKYAIMSNGEFDYDQAYCKTIKETDSIWLYPPQERVDLYARGVDTRYLLSFGPFTIHPGQTLPISFAYVAGADFHSDQDNFSNQPDNPDAFYAGLSFDDLAENATWASWIYDNPGVDSDSDNYAGKFRVCVEDSTIDSIYEDPENPGVLDTAWKYVVADTFYYEGDGVPDFQGAAPPPAPEFWVYPEQHSLRIRINGTLSETTPDVFSKMVDFEGYRIYLSRDTRSSSYSLMTSHDVLNFNRLVWQRKDGRWDFHLEDAPFSIEELRCLYGDSCNDLTFNPLDYTRTSRYFHKEYPNDSQFIFLPQDFNAWELDQPGRMRKIYPDEPMPTQFNPDLADPSQLTEDGFFKYFEYEYVIENLLPTVPYFVNVTAFDFGSPESGLSSLETSITVGAKQAFALDSWDVVQEGDKGIFVYPNPYRIDGDYRARGFEGRLDTENRPPNRTRELHFANMPPKATVRIYTIDGDLVREFEHDKEPSSDATHMHASFNLITRNTQMIVSGLYYWTVETPDGEVQMGTFAVLM